VPDKVALITGATGQDGAAGVEFIDENGGGASGTRRRVRSLPGFCVPTAT
jgi:GDP-D-mannose dehydratase